jgi:hypothetical protein
MTHYSLQPASNGGSWPAALWYGRCACGWTGKPTKSYAAAVAVTTRHIKADSVRAVEQAP